MADAKERAPRRSKEELFIERGERLTKKVILALRELRAIAKHGGYTEAQVETMFGAIEKDQLATEAAFKGEAQGDDDFSLAPAAPAA